MTQKRSLITLSNDQAIAWYQHHVQVLHGYALALALKAGLSPAEAATTFVEPSSMAAECLSKPKPRPRCLNSKPDKLRRS
jgi:hypothetical protein